MATNVFQENTLAERMNEVAPRFDKPSADPAFVMPVGTGDLSAMLRYDQELEIHLSKSDFYAFDACPERASHTIHSPGHVRLSFGIPPESIRTFEQRLDLNRGSVALTIETTQGTVKAEAFGIMGRNALLVAVEDSRSSAHATAEYSIWRPGMKVTTDGGRIVAAEIHDYDENGVKVADPAKAKPLDRMFNLGVGIAVALADKNGIRTIAGTVSSEGSSKTGTLRASPGNGKYWLVVACATSYDGSPESKAMTILDAMAKADKAVLLQEHLDWWGRFWQSSHIDLHGTDAEYLMRLWYVSYYSYACAAGTPHAPMKFNGGPGLIREDERTWGWGYWYQNTREMIWPMFAANRLDLARDYLDFYDRTFMDWKAQTAAQGKLGIRMWEGATPSHPAAEAKAKCLSAFDPAALDAALANRTMEDCASDYNARSLDQAAELTQLLFDYVAYTGDAEYLRGVVAPWLKETALFFLSYLKLESDGLYHMTPSDAIEMWWKVKDPMTDLCAARYILWKALNHGGEFGYEPEFMTAVRERVERLAPLPLGRWTRRVAIPGEIPPGSPPYYWQVIDQIEKNDQYYAPAADAFDDRIVHNQEHPELYIVYPIALVDANSPKADYERAVNTFRNREHANSAGWSQCPVQAARLRLPDAIDVIMDHASRHQKFPYGGWNCVATELAGSAMGVTDTPYFDTAGVNMTALQEVLLQCHTLVTPERIDPFAGGPIRILPAIREDWSGQFRLRARGGFIVTVVFQRNRTPETISIESERGGVLTLINPFKECRVSRAGKEILVTKEATIQLQTKPGDMIECIGISK